MNAVPAPVPLWKPVLFAALAGGLGWGIRGQYGHETGAMIAGLLVSLVLAVVFCPDAPAAPVIRAVAWGTVAIGFGGSMTYGQTVGLTHDPELVGRWDALRWGMLGLAIKGSLWIGFAGVFLGMALGGVPYRTREMVLVMLGMLALCTVGIWLLNSPYDPAHRVLPRIYFSDDWRWEPNANLKPRREVWGGFLAALLGLLAYTRFVRRDPLAAPLGLWAMLGGALGFPLGQSLQAWHAWNRAEFQTGFWARLDPHLNWWNFMETTFGTIMGAVLGLGLWTLRHRIAIGRTTAAPSPPPPPLPLPIEIVLLAVHVSLLVAVEFLSIPTVDRLYDFGLGLGFIPVIAVARGRWWPMAVLFPITVIPIAGKTYVNLVTEAHALPPAAGALLYLILPIALGLAAAVRLGIRVRDGRPAGDVVGPALLIATWLYFGLNFAFFRFPWPWAGWTSRTPNGIIYTVCALALTALALSLRRRPTPGAPLPALRPGGTPAVASGR